MRGSGVRFPPPEFRVKSRGVEALAAERWTFNPEGESSSLSSPITCCSTDIQIPRSIPTINESSRRSSMVERSLDKRLMMVRFHPPRPTLCGMAQTGSAPGSEPGDGGSTPSPAVHTHICAPALFSRGTQIFLRGIFIRMTRGARGCGRRVSARRRL
jgi:hypothetical protein